MDLSQPYDSSLKTLFEGHAAEIVHHLLKVEYVDELGTEALKPPLRADRVYLILYHGMLCILHAELETASDSEMDYRMLEYYGILLRKHRKPILPVVIYPFRTTLPKSPLRVTVGDKKVVEFHFDIIAMWEESAKYYLDNHVIGMYPLLPTMQEATYEALMQGLQEMKGWYGESRRMLGEKIMLFDVFLERSDMVSAEDKERLEATLEEYRSFVGQSPLVRKMLEDAKAEGKEEGLAEGEIKGKIKILQKMLVDMVRGRFPPLAELAQQTAVEVSEPQKLELLVKGVSTAPDENVARWVLTTLAA
jgi:hypothetical protein